MPAKQIVTEVVARALIVGNAARDQWITLLGEAFNTFSQCIVVPAHQLTRTENRQALAIEQAQMLIVTNQGTAWCSVVAQHIAAKEG